MGSDSFETGAAKFDTVLWVGERLVHFESAACDYCGSEIESPVLTSRDRSLGLPGVFRLIKCVSCGLIRQNPRPILKDMDAYYPPSYEPFSTATAIEDETSLWRRIDRRYGMYKRRRLVERCQRSGNILDVGCATGNFLAEMAASDRWRVVGIEPNENAASYAMKRHKLDVHRGWIADAPFQAAQFDVITLWNVLEHLHQPVSELHRINRWLKPGGWLIFSLPNFESFERKLFGDRWFVWELPRHLYIFPRDVLRKILRDSGFELVRSECLSASHMSFALSVRQLIQPGEPFPLWYYPAIRFLESVPGRLLLAPFFFGVSQAKQATIVTYVARKL